VKRYYVVVIATFIIGGCLCWPSQITVTKQQALTALENARGVLGKPYVWAGRGPDEFDCSGLITWSYKQAIGKDAIFRIRGTRASDASMQDLQRFNVVPLLLDEIAPGDIVFITNEHDKVTHGGLFIRWVSKNEFEFVNASSHYGRVVIDTWPVLGTKRDQWFAGAGRLKTAY